MFNLLFQKSVKLLKTFYFYDIGLFLIETLISVGCIIFMVYAVFILHGIKKYEASFIKRIFSLAAYLTTYIGKLHLLLKITYRGLETNCTTHFFFYISTSPKLTRSTNLRTLKPFTTLVFLRKSHSRQSLATCITMFFSTLTVENCPLTYHF